MTLTREGKPDGGTGGLAASSDLAEVGVLKIIVVLEPVPDESIEADVSEPNQSKLGVGHTSDRVVDPRRRSEYSNPFASLPPGA